VTARFAVPCGLGAIVVGILVGRSIGGSGAPGAIAALAVVLAVAAVVRGPGRAVALLLACGLVGMVSMQRSLHGIEVTPIDDLIDARADVQLHGRLVGDPTGTPYRVRVVVRVDRADVRGVHRDGGGRHVLLTSGGQAAARLRLLAAGDRLVVDAWLDPLDEWERWWRRRHVVAAARVQRVVSVRDPSTPLDLVANGVRSRVLAGGGALPGGDRALLAGLLLGDTRGVDERTEEAFRAAGMTHLLAVSGGNLAMVVAALAPVTSRLGWRARFVAGIAVVVVFGTMTRWEPSVLRASAMAVVTMVAAVLGRPAIAWRALATAALLLLVVDPLLIDSVGFQLSCTASLGLCVLSAPLTRRLRGPTWFREALAAALAAQLGAAPVLLAAFDELPLVGIPANVVAAPLIGPLTVWGLASGVVGGLVRPIAPPVADLLVVPTAVMLRALRLVAGLGASMPMVVDRREVLAATVAAALGAASHQARRLRRDGPPDARPAAPRARSGCLPAGRRGP
jgi:competence protein ComEC